MNRITTTAIILLFASISTTLADATIDAAKKFFDRYVALEASFDPKVADLYADDAKIQNTRISSDGQKKVMTMPAPAYKELIRQVMPLAKQRGDTSIYSNVKFTQEDDKVRITATRYSNLKKYSSPISLLIAPSEKGVWLISEELSESRP